MIRSIKYDSICKIIVLCCNFLLFSSFLLKHILNNANVMNVLCFYKKKKKRLRGDTIINIVISRSFCSAPFLFCAFFALRPFCSAPFFPAPFLFCALIVRALFAAPKCGGSQVDWVKLVCIKSVTSSMDLVFVAF